MEYPLIQARIREIQSRLSEASGQYGEARLCAVTKTVDVDRINSILPTGVRIIGENRVQEILQKMPALNPQFQLHLIGQLQTNKVKYIVNHVSMVQSLNRMSLAEELSKRAQMAGRVMPVLVEVNIAQEASKAGIAQEEVESFLCACAKLPGISVNGLMAMMPLAQDPEALRPYFRGMRALFERMRDLAVPGVAMECLSMGMSNDWVIAAQEGSTMVRVGSAIFGKRI